MANDRNKEALLDDEALLREARDVIRPLPPVEPRAGFAARVALAARDGRTRPFGAPWWRWAAGGLAVAGVAAAAVLLAQPRAPRPSEVMLAQRLELYEDMSVIQHQDALEELDVVAVLHQLQPEGAP